MVVVWLDSVVLVRNTTQEGRDNVFSRNAIRFARNWIVFGSIDRWTDGGVGVDGFVWRKVRVGGRLPGDRCVVRSGGGMHLQCGRKIEFLGQFWT